GAQARAAPLPCRARGDAGDPRRGVRGRGRWDHALLLRRHGDRQALSRPGIADLARGAGDLPEGPRAPRGGEARTRRPPRRRDRLPVPPAPAPPGPAQRARLPHDHRRARGRAAWRAARRARGPHVGERPHAPPPAATPAPVPPGLRVRLLFTAAEELDYLGARAYVRDVGVSGVVGALSLELCGIGDSLVVWDAAEETPVTRAFRAALDALGLQADAGYHVVGRSPRF